MNEIIVDEKIMEQATFEGVCKLLKNRKDDGTLLKCVVPLAKLLTLVVPGLTFAKPVNMEWFGDILDRGLTLLDSSEHCWDVIKNLGEVLRKEEPDYVKRANNAAMAYVLIVYTAFFDAAKKMVAGAGVDVDFDGYAKSAITEKAWAALQERYVLPDQSLPRWELKIPGPAEPMGNEDDNLREFYELMERRLDAYLEGLKEIGSLDPAHRKLLHDLMGKLPEEALVHYKALYLDLSEKYPSFAIWTRQVEHRQIEERIISQEQKVREEHGEILKAIENVSQMMQEHVADQTLKCLYQQNRDAVMKELIISSFEMFHEDEIKLPIRVDSFVPQNFSYQLCQTNKLRLEENSWEKGTDLIDFISHAVCHQALTKKPLLILGGPGAGKTMLMKMLAGKYLLRSFHVIVVRLRDLGNDRTLYENVQKQINFTLGDMEVGGSWEQLVRAKVQLPVLVIFDGYDELLLASNAEKNLFLMRVAEFQKKSSLAVHTIVTSRITLIKHNEIPKNTTVIRLDGFGEEQICRWSEKWNTFQAAYFKARGLEALQIPTKGNIAELARQPLLLLMLALYDAMENSLRKDQNLDQAQLYYKLIKRFIGREEKKINADFDETDGFAIIEREMERLGVTALGMYNRDRIHIHVEQLKKDLDFLKVPPYSNDLKDEVRLLRRFFFIHHMEKKGTNHSFGAVEFLHNSFGEFLAAHYMVSWLKKLLVRDKAEKAWYAAMAYVPLYTRPNVAVMLRQWAKTAMEKDLELFQGWIYNEVVRALRGDMVSQMLEATGGFVRENDYECLDLMTHNAIYVCNLMCVGTLILGQMEIDTLEQIMPHAWEKLLRLWQFGLGEDGMVSFSRVFMVAEDWKPVFVFKDRSSEIHHENNRDGNLWEFYRNLRMEPEISLLSALRGGYDDVSKETADMQMMKQRLPYVPQMTFQDALNAFATDSSYQQGMLISVKELAQQLGSAHWKHTKGTQVGILLILKQFAEIEPKYCWSVLKPHLSEIWDTFKWGATPMLMRLIVDLMWTMPTEQMDEDILQWLMESISSYDMGKLELDRIVRYVAQLSSNGEDEDVRQFLIRFAEYIENERLYFSEQTVPYLIKILENLDKMGYQGYELWEPISVIEKCIRILSNKIEFGRTEFVTPEILAGLLSIIWDKGWQSKIDFLTPIWDLAKKAGLEMKDLYLARPNLVERMCENARGLDISTDQFRTWRLRELVSQCPEELSMKHHRMIRNVAEQTSDRKLKNKLNQITL